MQVVHKAPDVGLSPSRAGGAFDPGNLIWCEFGVVTPTPRHYVVVDDRLPRASEAVDINLRKGGDGLYRFEE